MSRRAFRRTSLKAIKPLVAVLAAALAVPHSSADVAQRATQRARGNDRPTAVAVGRALLAQPLPAQLTQIRCEKIAAHRMCGLVVSGVKFKHPLNRGEFLAEVRRLVRGAFSAAPLEEVDLWATVPLGAGTGSVTSGDFAVATSATVFAVTVPRAALTTFDAQLGSGRDVYWDTAFAAALAKGNAL